jgi:hypothetical protein
MDELAKAFAGVLDEGVCRYDDCGLLPVEVADAASPFDYDAWQCPLCERVYSMGMEMDITGCEIKPLAAPVVE